ncbi:hypothetical protein [Vampirovibrio sp.]|uniref:hypothetical protein n=1 Tax=Vampirovibrio sp. TaxID=2717857 RepID=UPI0035934C50
MSIINGAIKHLHTPLLQKSLMATTLPTLQKSRLFLPPAQDSFKAGAKIAPKMAEKTEAAIAEESFLRQKIRELFGPSPKSGV